MEKLVFFDTEVSTKTQKVFDIGAISENNAFHSSSLADFAQFIRDAKFLCGHNIINHDWKILQENALFQDMQPELIDTLYWSPLLFPQRPYHKLVKDDKICSDDVNNPYNDALKAKILFDDEVAAFSRLPDFMKKIYYNLLFEHKEFSGFLQYINYEETAYVEDVIKENFKSKICTNANIAYLIRNYPKELAYSLALIYSQDKYSITPPWVIKNYPKVEYVIKVLCETRCHEGCSYCNNHLNIKTKLKDYFGYDDYRTYEGEPLQAKAVQAAVDGKSLLAIFPTGGGKSITFQVPAFISGENVRGLTVVISPLQSLMKDQVDNLEKKHDIIDAVTINGSLSPIERRDAFNRVASGTASLLYISPESLRSKTIQKLLLSRNVVRFVIDEAHCFSAWGQDFRIDYLYIGEFIRNYQEFKHLDYKIPVSCFTATAKQKVVSDICDYFRKELDLELEVFSSSATRNNLHYKVLFKENAEEKYFELRNLIRAKHCPTIVYVSRVKKTLELAERLRADGFSALSYNGKMDNKEKIANQNSFMAGETDIIVATSAFGMGVDKDNVGLVVHFEISDSLENYVQEAGRAGRDQSLQADCYVLFNDDDLNAHFNLLNQTKLSISEIQQVWQAVKYLTKKRDSFTKTPLEIARASGWNEDANDIETKVKTALQTLENAGYIKRGNNVPHIYASGILVKNIKEGADKLDKSTSFEENDKETSKRILKFLISRKYISKAGNDDAESRVDYIADRLGIETYKVIDIINKMREEGIVADTEDMSAHIHRDDNSASSIRILNRLSKIERFLIDNYEELNSFSYKEMNDKAIHSGIEKSTIKDIKTVLLYWRICKYIGKKQTEDPQLVVYELKQSIEDIKQNIGKRIELSDFIIKYLFEKAQNANSDGTIQFSILELKDQYNSRTSLFASQIQISTNEIKDALTYLSKIDALDIEGGFLVFYNALQIKRKVTDNKIKYKKDDYAQLQDFYTQRMQQIHIVGEYAHLMVKDYNEAQTFVKDYFNLDYKLFQRKYFKGNRLGEIEKNITPQKYNKLFGELSAVQRSIIDDNSSKYIVVAAGPGSGKTKVLVHKLASLLLLEDVKSEQLLMLTFSRSAATEFKKRLVALIGSAANYVEIKTFHSYCFDLIGQIGSLEGSEDVVVKATEMIKSGEVETGRITKNVLVIDEAQDINEQEFNLIQALMTANENMRVIAVGDDDQNIYEFRGSNSNYMKSFIDTYNAKTYEMLDNYRSCKSIISLANQFVKNIPNRMKQNEIVPVRNDFGEVLITKFKSQYLEEPTLNMIKSTYKGGSCCVLTKTNDEAFGFVSLLKEHGYSAKLIQSNEGFDLYNLYEIRSFVGKLRKECKTALIPDDIWDKCVKDFQSYFAESSCLEDCLNLINDFDKNNQHKYISDFIIYVKEAKFDAFIGKEDNTILVSTLHKAKGKEFDNVYMMLDNYIMQTEETKRVLYVGMTRAKKNLYINYNNRIFENCNISDFTQDQDNKEYRQPRNIFMQLGHDGVNLGYFKYSKSKIKNLISGQKLYYENDTLNVNHGDKAIQLSNKTKEKIKDLEARGYKLKSADVRFKVYWQGKKEEQESLIILPNLYFEKN